MKTQTTLPNSSTFKAGGELTSEGEFKTDVTVLVKDVLPNGELKVAGDKVVNINGSEARLEVSGIVRPENIMEGNKVYSTQLANARINYSQSGEIQNVVEPGLITKIFNMVF
jgi:flagellar L-ring protein FlgH